MEDVYTASEACKLTGATRPQLQHWNQSGTIRPSVRQAEGRGDRRLYNVRDLTYIRAAAALTRCGCSGETLRWVLRQDGPFEQAMKDRDEVLVLFDVGPSSWVMSGRLVEADAERHEAYIVVNLALVSRGWAGW